MEQPSTPPTRTATPAEMTPEHGLLPPLSVNTMAVWMDHAWYDEDAFTTHHATEEVWCLYHELSVAGDRVLRRRAELLIDWMQDCFDTIVFGPLDAIADALAM
jgi:hypothetical protein